MKRGVETELVWVAVKPKTLLPVLGLKPFLDTFLVIYTSDLEENPELYSDATTWHVLQFMYSLGGRISTPITMVGEVVLYKSVI